MNIDRDLKSLTIQIESEIRRIAASYGLSTIELTIIRVLLADGGSSVTGLSRSLSISDPVISRAAYRLANRGLLSRHRTRKDRRVVIMKLTEEGNELGLKARQSVLAYEEILTKGINRCDMEEFRSMVTQMQRNACREANSQIGNNAESQ